MVTDMKGVREGYKITELGEIPEEWEVTTVGETFELIGGSPLPRSKTGVGNTVYLHYGDIHKTNKSILDSLTDNWLPRIDMDSVKVKGDSLMESGDIVFADASEDLADIGKNVVIKVNNKEGFVAGLHTIIARDKGDLSIGYKRYCFKTENVRKQLSRLATGSTVLGISKTNLKKIIYCMPPLKEQEKIAEILSSVDETIETTDQLLEKTKELKKGLMQQLLTKGIGHTRFKKTELGEIPEGWEVYTLKSISENITIGLVTTMTKYYAENGVLLIRNSDIKENKFLTSRMVRLDKEFAEKYSKKRLKIGDVITVHTGDIGTSSVIESELVGAHGFATLNTTPNQDIIDSYYLSYFLNSSISKNQVYNFSTGDGRNNLNLKDFNKLLITVPKYISEQKQIVEILTSVDEQIGAYEKEKEKLINLKKGLMQLLLTGKIRVTL
jgi:type I restriction enzyme, S subunit